MIRRLPVAHCIADVFCASNEVATWRGISIALLIQSLDLSVPLISYRAWHNLYVISVVFFHWDGTGAVPYRAPEWDEV